MLVVRGEAGVGKTALLHHCARHAAGFRVARVAGVEPERELAFSGVHQLCAPLLGGLDALPAPQERALRVALGLSLGHPPDRFLVALAVLGLLAATAEERPLLCLVDDAQWLDDASGQVLGFVARRLLAESVALVLAVRDPIDGHDLHGLPELRLGGLEERDARALLAAAIPGRLHDRMRDRIVAETRGNPLALLELPRRMSAAQLAGGFDLPAPADLPRHVERQHAERIRALPRSTQRLLLLAAAEPVGDAAVLWRAAERLGIAASALLPAQADRLLEVGARVGFRHPLVRSAAYRGASAEDRRAVHEALADACDPQVDADRRAWHRALASSGPDEAVAAELEHAAGRAQLRGGLAAAAAFLERATELTPDRARRTVRALAAAEVEQLAGAPETALRLLGDAEAGPLDEAQRARVQLVRGRVALGSGHAGDAPPQLLAAARGLAAVDSAAARDAHLDALSAALLAGRLAGDVDAAQVARAARAAAPPSADPHDLLLDGLAAVVHEGHAAGAPLLRRAVDALRAADLPPAQAVRRLGPATHAAHALWDDDAWAQLGGRHVVLARHAGALAVLPAALGARVGLHLLAGEPERAAALVEELATVTEATGSELPPYGAVAVAAFGGREPEAARLVRTVRAEAAARGDGMGLTLVEHAEAVLLNGLARYAEAAAAARRGAADPRELGWSAASLVELVEAAARSDQPAVAADALDRLAQTTRASGTDWALGVEARSRALISDDDEAERLHREAIERLGRTRVRAELARAHLLYGEWLRRRGRRTDARGQLGTAHELFTGMGMEAFAERSGRELAGTGERTRRRGHATRDELTRQELQIAGLARDGLSNPEIGARLFLSPRTVEWHLKKVFAKLGIRSRMALHDTLPDRGRDPAPA